MNQLACSANMSNYKDIDRAEVKFMHGEEFDKYVCLEKKISFWKNFWPFKCSFQEFTTPQTRRNILGTCSEYGCLTRIGWIPKSSLCR